MAYAIVVNAQTTTTPSGGGTAWSTINAGGGSDSASSNAPSNNSSFDTAKWSDFSTNFGGRGPNDIQLLVGSFNWSAGGECTAHVESDGASDSGCSATADFFGGVSGSNGFFRSAGASITGPGPDDDEDSFSDGGLVTATLTPNNLSSITGAQVTASIDTSANSSFDASSSAAVSIGLDTIQITVTLTDRQVIAC